MHPVTDPLSDDDTLAARLAARPAQQLAQFIVSLRHGPDPVGEHVRTFLLADDGAACVAAIETRIAAFAQPTGRRVARTPRAHRIGATLDYVLDDIEQLVLPHNPLKAFTLLVRFLACDAAAAERSTEEDWETQQAFERAVILLTQLAPSVPIEQRAHAAARLLTADHYGLKHGLREALLQPADHPGSRSLK